MNFDDFNTNKNIRKYHVGDWGISDESSVTPNTIVPKETYYKDIFQEVKKQQPSFPRQISNLMEDVREKTGLDRLVKVNDKFFMVSRLDKSLDFDMMNYPKYIYSAEDLSPINYSWFTVRGINNEEFFDGVYMDTKLDELKNLFKEREFYSISDAYEIIQDYETMEEL